MAETLTFVVICAYCGTVLDAIPIPDPGDWKEGNAWAIVAQEKHAPDCPERRNKQ